MYKVLIFSILSGGRPWEEVGEVRELENRRPRFCIQMDTMYTISYHEIYTVTTVVLRKG